MNFMTTGLRFSLVAGAALALAACGHQSETAANVTANDLDSNVMMEQTGNDASAMESSTNLAEPVATTNTAIESNATDHSGGDAAQDPVDSNVAGM
jgi:hypothetical protein